MFKLCSAVFFYSILAFLFPPILKEWLVPLLFRYSHSHLFTSHIFSLWPISTFLGFFDTDILSPFPLVSQECFAAFNFHPGFSFVVVSKRIHSRLFAEGASTGRPVNPPPGTVCDDVITLPERCAFATSIHTSLHACTDTNNTVLSPLHSLPHLFPHWLWWHDVPQLLPT